ncbi:hypothetical protein EDB89DRAFT_1903631 [Lactarius sanguifluus]|nr:hypothetical protein EDB89DRAFT_1903631 [Lactarius sanguifluus]
MIRCPGCDKGFTRHGLSLHISKTRCRGCQNLHQSLQTRMVVQPAQAASSLAPNTGPKAADGPIGHEPAWEDETDAASSESSQQGDSANEADSIGDEADHTGDPVDTADANAFKSISRDGNFSSLVTPEPEQVHAILTQGRFHLSFDFLMVKLALQWLVVRFKVLPMGRHVTGRVTQCGPPFGPNATGSSHAGQRSSANPGLLQESAAALYSGHSSPQFL